MYKTNTGGTAAAPAVVCALSHYVDALGLVGELLFNTRAVLVVQTLPKTNLS